MIMRNFLLLLLLPIFSYSQSIKGVITDGELEDAPLTFAHISIEGTDLETLTDFDGSFQFENLQEGTYKLTIRFLGYESKTLKGIEINSKGTYRVSESLYSISLN